MHIDIKNFLNDADIQEELYPGKRLIKSCKQMGEFKNHCVVMDWRDPETLKIEIQPGLSGKQLAPEIQKKYPVCFQMPTYVKIKVTNDNDGSEEDEDESKGKSGKSGGGSGKKPAKKKLEDIAVIAARFGHEAEGKIPSVGEVKEEFMQPVGDETAQYQYDREKNANIGMKMSLG